MEYKSPDDYVSIIDFYKVYGYACLYASFENVPITNLTITFVESHYPEKLLAHLKDTRGYSVEETSRGIYTVRGDVMPIQLIDNRQLSEDENLWLKGLYNHLEPLAVLKISEAAIRQGKAARIHAYLNVIIQANARAIQEAMKMSDDALTLDQVLEESGWTAKWEAKGEARGEARGVAIGEARGVAIGEARGVAMGEERKAHSIAQNLVNLGFPLEDIVTATQLDPEKVKAMYQGQKKREK